MRFSHITMSKDFPFPTISHTLPASFLREYPRAKADQNVDLSLEVKEHIHLASPVQHKMKAALQMPSLSLQPVALGLSKSYTNRCLPKCSSER
jgi:hypothetical protein